MKTKVTVLAGYVESGRSSLIRHVLASCPAGLSTAVIVDDAAELRLNAALFAAEQQGVHELALKSGCMCISSRRKGVLGHLVAACARGFDYILVQGAGVGESATFIQDFEEAVTAEGQPLSDMACIDTVVAIIGADAFLSDFESKDLLGDLPNAAQEAGEDEDTGVVELLVEQIEYATTIVVNKADLVEQAEMSRILDLLRLLNPDARQVVAQHGKADLSTILGSGQTVTSESVRDFAGVSKALLGDAAFLSAHHPFVFRARRPFHPRRLHNLLEGARNGRNALSTSVRSEGQLWLASRNGCSGDWFQAGKIFELAVGGEWFANIARPKWPVDKAQEIEALMEGEHGDRRQEIAFLGDGLNHLGIEECLAECLLTDTEFSAPDAWEGLEDPFDGWVLEIEDGEDVHPAHANGVAAAAGPAEGTDASWESALAM